MISTLRLRFVLRFMGSASVVLIFAGDRLAQTLAGAVHHAVDAHIYECALPEELESYLDMCDFGSYLIKQHDGRFVMGGFVCMESGCSLEQIMGPEEQTEAQTMQL
mgnify:CR=1 FL=1